MKEAKQVAESSLTPSGPTVPSRRSGTWRHSVLSLGTSACIQILNLVSGVITARMLGPTGRGELAAIFVWPYLLATLGGLGTGDAVAYFTARAKGLRRAIAASGVVLSAAQSVVLLAIGLLLIPIVLRHFGSATVQAGLLYLAWLPLALVTMAWMGVLQGALEIVAFNRVRLTVVAATVCGLLVLYVAHHVGVVQVVLVYVGANLLTTVVAGAELARRGWLSLRPGRLLMRSMMAYGVRAHSGNVAGAANERADQAIISLILPSFFLGQYTVAVTVTGALGLIGSSMAMVTLPVVASFSERVAAVNEFARLLWATFFISAICATALFVASPFLVPKIFGIAFVPAIPVARLLLIGAVILSVNRVLGAGLKALNYPLAPGIAEAIALSVTAVALIVLLPKFGIMGAAVASVLAYATSSAFMIWFASTKGGFPPISSFPRRSRNIFGGTP